jgi:hypothetical protein
MSFEHLETLLKQSEEAHAAYRIAFEVARDVTGDHWEESVAAKDAAWQVYVEARDAYRAALAAFNAPAATQESIVWQQVNFGGGQS